MSNLTVGINRTHLICFVERKCLRQSRRYEQCSHPLPLNGSRAYDNWVMNLSWISQIPWQFFSDSVPWHRCHGQLRNRLFCLENLTGKTADCRRKGLWNRRIRGLCSSWRNQQKRKLGKLCFYKSFPKQKVKHLIISDLTFFNTTKVFQNVKLLEKMCIFAEPISWRGINNQ